MTQTKQIAILGTGAIGKSLGQQWYEAGHEIVFGSRNPDGQNEDLKAMADGRITITDIARAVELADIVVLAVPHHSLEMVADVIRPLVGGKIIVDCTNAVEFTPDGCLASGLSTDETEGRYAAKLFPESDVVRTFTHIQDELLDSRGRRQPGIWAAAVAADDAKAKRVVSELVQDIGFVPVDNGALDDSAP